MNQESKYLAVDIGAESGRVVVGTFDGRRIVLEEIHRFPNRQMRNASGLQWDVEGLFGEVKKGILFAAQRGYRDIRSIGIDTWGVDFGLLTGEGELIEPPFAYRDSRTDGMMEAVSRKMASDDIYAATGIQGLQINTLFQLYSVAQRRPEILRRADRLLFMPDLFNYFLTGERYSERTIASTSQLLNARTGTWDENVFEALGLPLHIMPTIVPPGCVLGTLRSHVADESGLKRMNVVSVGSHDTASAVVGVPASGERWAFLSSGTWSLIGTERDEPVLDATLQNDFTNERGVGGKVLFLRNVAGLWLLQEVRRSWQNGGASLSYEDIATLASTTKSIGTYINPDDPLFLNPPDMPGAIEEYCRKNSLQAPRTNGEMARCILEGLALKYRSVLEKISSVTGERPDVLHIVGGGSQNGFLNQLTADVGGIPVVAGPVEATAMGNILVQAVAAGELDTIQRGREVVANSVQLKTYQPQQSEKWDEVYETASPAFR